MKAGDPALQCQFLKDEKQAQRLGSLHFLKIYTLGNKYLND
jgi:hypothetical protein